MRATKVFFDTNILLYLLSDNEEKANRAEATVKLGGIISVQVLNEIVNVTRRKFSMPWEKINEFLLLICSLCTVKPLTLEAHDKGRFLAERYQLSVYDAMIVSVALITNCEILYSEDMQHNLMIEKKLRICNPFR